MSLFYDTTVSGVGSDKVLFSLSKDPSAVVVDEGDGSNRLIMYRLPYTTNILLNNPEIQLFPAIRIPDIWRTFPILPPSDFCHIALQPTLRAANFHVQKSSISYPYHILAL